MSSRDFVIIVGKVFLRSVGHDKFRPFFRWFRKQKTFKFLHFPVVKLIDIDVATIGHLFTHTPFNPFL